LSAAADVCATRLPAAIGDVLTEIADALSDAREPRDSRGAWASIEACVAGLAPVPAIDVLLGQLRAAWRTAHVLSASSADSETTRIRPLRYRPPVSDALTTLRANLTLDSAVFRHALRLAAAPP
jgi:uncharacterized membrane protein YccC